MGAWVRAWVREWGRTRTMMKMKCFRGGTLSASPTLVIKNFLLLSGFVTFSNSWKVYYPTQVKPPFFSLFFLLGFSWVWVSCKLFYWPVVYTSFIFI